jgi:NAD(P)-dependent dehydrogenase (short-subunit alcohol dehydrogenase family)
MADSRPVPVVLVTGASRGLGRGIALGAARLGFSVAINFAKNAAAAEEARRLCEEQRITPAQRFVAIQADVALATDRDRLVVSTLEQLGRIDAVVSNAGVAPLARADITETSEESFDRVLKTNLYGPFFLTQRVVKYWLKDKPVPLLKGGFKVIVVSSVSANTVSVNRGEYCISKAGLAMVTQLWAVRLATEGVQVFELRPGIMETDMTGAVKEKYDRLIGNGLVPMRRWGQPDDVGEAVAAILEGRFPYTTGDVFNIDGGMQLRAF